MKGVTEMLDILGRIIFIVGVAVTAIFIFQVILGGFNPIGCDAKKSEAMRVILSDALKPNSLNSINFTLPDCVEMFKASDYSYCFKDPGKEYDCKDTSKTGENIRFDVPEKGRGDYCFYVFGVGAQGNPNLDNPTVKYISDGKCK